jgi:hypothetical protein
MGASSDVVANDLGDAVGRGALVFGRRLVPLSFTNMLILPVVKRPVARGARDQGRDSPHLIDVESEHG